MIQGVIFDITERKLAEEQVAFLAYHDKLTGLPNRALFEEMLEAAILARAAMTSAWECSTSTSTTSSSQNDSLGHHAGDELLKQLAERLRGCTRETDLVARQGGDEFLLLLADLERGIGPVAGTKPDCSSPSPWPPGARGAPRAVRPGRRRVLHVGLLGVSLFPQDATDATSLLKNADTAMYHRRRRSRAVRSCSRAGRRRRRAFCR